MASRCSIIPLLLALAISLRICSSRKVELRTKETELEHILQPNSLSLSTRIDPSKVIQVSWHPRAFIYEGFLSFDECEHIISLAHGTKKLLATNSDSRNSTVINTQNGVFVARGQDDIVSKIEERISAWTFLPKENGEDMRIMRYGTNASYEPHHEYYYDKSKLELGGHRVATVLMYLSNVTLGGETIFPRSSLQDGRTECGGTGYVVKPVKGNALLLFDLHPDATPDESSLQGSCKVIEGEKWTATKWIHVRAFDTSKPSSLGSDGGDCTDEDDRCPNWAAIGECQRNPVYMLGTPDYYGSCRRSCDAC